MSWFDEQLNFRKQTDDAGISDAIDSIAGAVMGKRLSEALDSREIAGSAIEEILKYYKFKSKNTDLPSNIKTVDEQLDYRMKPFGIMRRSVLLEKGWYKNAVGAMLGTLKSDGSAVALIPGKIGGYTFYDFKTGRRVKLSRRTEKLLDEEALCFYKPLPAKPISMAELVRFSLEQLSVSDIAQYVAMMVLTTLLGLLSPLFTKWLFGTVLEMGSSRLLISLASFMVCFTLSQICTQTFLSLAGAKIKLKQNTVLQAAVMNRLLSLPAGFFRDYSAGELNQRASYILSLCTNIMDAIGTTGLTSLFSLVYLGQIFAFAPALVVPALLITLLTLFFSLAVTFVQMKVTREKMLVSSKTSGMTYSLITGIQKIKLAGAEKRMFSRWAKQYSKEASLEYNPPTFVKLGTTINLAINLAGTLILFAAAVRSGVSVANYYAFNTSYAMISGAFTALAGITVTVANIKPTLEMAKPILDSEPEVSSAKHSVTSLRGQIELSNVCFRYEDNMPNVIDGLSLKITPGEYVAIVGTTGCGKSTLMRLLLGFEKPQKGSIMYDGKDIGALNLETLRRRIGTVMQDGKLFLGDIYSNIVISAPQLTLDEAWEAAETAAIADDIRAMPMGMHTVISEGQGGISGGQKQRLMIARAVAPKPKILMFDEATSALDNVTQKKVCEAIDKLKCTRIVIAHRLSTIRRCDRIIVLDKGNIAESGTYEELIGKNGLFASLVARQRLDTGESEVQK